MSPSQLTNSYASEGWLNHQPVLYEYENGVRLNPLVYHHFPKKKFTLLQDPEHISVFVELVVQPLRGMV